MKNGIFIIGILFFVICLLFNPGKKDFEKFAKFDNYGLISKASARTFNGFFFSIYEIRYKTDSRQLTDGQLKFYTENNHYRKYLGLADNFFLLKKDDWYLNLDTLSKPYPYTTDPLDNVPDPPK